MEKTKYSVKDTLDNVLHANDNKRALEVQKQKEHKIYGISISAVVAGFAYAAYTKYATSKELDSYKSQIASIARRVSALEADISGIQEDTDNLKDTIKRIKPESE